LRQWGHCRDPQGGGEHKAGRGKEDVGLERFRREHVPANLLEGIKKRQSESMASGGEKRRRSARLEKLELRFT